MKNIQQIAKELSKSVDLSGYFDPKTNLYTRELNQQEKAILQAVADLGVIANQDESADYSDAQE